MDVQKTVDFLNEHIVKGTSAATPHLFVYVEESEVNNLEITENLMMLYSL